VAVKLWVVRDDLRTYWVGAATPLSALSVLRRYLAVFEKLETSEIVEALGDGVEVERASDAPDPIWETFEKKQARIVYATQWEGDEPKVTTQVRRSKRRRWT
jgi:hypothetical protein